MILLTVLAFVAFLVARANQRAALRRRRTDTLRYYLLTSFIDFLKMLLVVIALYCGLWLFVEIFPDWISTVRLIGIEEMLSRLAFYSKLFKLTSLIAISVLFGLYALGLWKRVPVFERYRKVTKRVYQFLTLLCCFTLLGFEAGSPAVALSLRVKRNRAEYGLLQQNIARTLDERVAGRLLRRVSDSFPPEYRADSLDRVGAADQKIRSLEGSYREIKENGGASPALGKFLADHPPVDDTGEQGPETRAELGSHPAEFGDERDRVNYREIENAEAALAVISKKTSSGGDGQELGEKVALELFKSAREHARDHFLLSITHEFPIFGPVSDIVSAALDKRAEASIRRNSARIASARIGNADEMDAEVSRSAESLAQSLTIKTTFQPHTREGQAVRSWQTELQQIDAYAATAPAQVVELKERAANAREMENFRDGLSHHWVVSRNSSDDPERLFVHAEMESSGALEDLKFLVKESPDGNTWEVYLPPDGSEKYGRRVGSIPTPTDVEVFECGCR